jgi:eukaryotic-like serine/threonine-protein kinase
MSFTVGEIVGDYQIVGRLGAGGMGAVYKARHVISDRLEALKIVLPDLGHAPELADRFIREIKIQASLSHPNIAVFHTVVRIENRLLMVMELVEGQSLDQRLRTEGVDLYQGVNYLAQTLSALSYAHGRGIVHRDIKPANIMITPEDAVKLLDFGIARGPDARKLTAAGVMMGSLHYMSPEQIRAESMDARSDIYALGATFYEVFTGKCPFESESSYMVMTGHLEQQAKPLDTVNPNVPAALSEVMLKALRKEPADRFQTAGEFLAALQTLESILPAARVNALPKTLGPDFPTRSMMMTKIEDKHSTATREREGWDPQTLDKLAKALAVFVGPIAKILVKRASTETRSLPALYAKLAEEIESEDDRRRFLATRPKEPA